MGIFLFLQQNLAKEALKTLPDGGVLAPAAKECLRRSIARETKLPNESVSIENVARFFDFALMAFGCTVVALLLEMFLGGALVLRRNKRDGKHWATKSEKLPVYPPVRKLVFVHVHFKEQVRME